MRHVLTALALASSLSSSLQAADYRHEQATYITMEAVSIMRSIRQHVEVDHETGHLSLRPTSYQFGYAEEGTAKLVSEVSDWNDWSILEADSPEDFELPHTGPQFVDKGPGGKLPQSITTERHHCDLLRFLRLSPQNLSELLSLSELELPELEVEQQGKSSCVHWEPEAIEILAGESSGDVVWDVLKSFDGLVSVSELISEGGLLELSAECSWPTEDPLAWDLSVTVNFPCNGKHTGIAYSSVNQRLD